MPVVPAGWNERKCSMSSPGRGWIKDKRNKAGRKEPNCLSSLVAWGGGRRAVGGEAMLRGWFGANLGAPPDNKGTRDIVVADQRTT